VCAFSEAIPENAASRQSVWPAGTSSRFPAGNYAPAAVIRIFLASPSSAAAKNFPNLVRAACVVGEIANTASSSEVDESSKLPKASGCAPLRW